MRDMVEAGKILQFRVGSHLYGTNRPESDEDFSGVFIPTINYFFGFDKVEEVDMSIVAKGANGRNTKDAVDMKFYEIRKFVKLALENNPNIIEQLFADPKNILFMNCYGEQLLNERHNFLHKGLKHRFIGYAVSQKQKMFVKRDNMLDIESGIKALKILPPKDYIAQHLANYLLSCDYIFKDAGNQHIQCGDIHIQKNITIDRALEQLEERKAKFSSRKEMVDDFGYDTKFAMHLIRLLLEGKELLETGNLVFPLQDADYLKDIRNGSYSLADVVSMAEEIEADIEIEYANSYLPAKPKYDYINELLINMLEEHFSDRK